MLIIKIFLTLVGLFILTISLLVFKTGIKYLRKPLKKQDLKLHGFLFPIPSHTRFNGFVFVTIGGFVIILILIIFIAVLSHT